MFNIVNSWIWTVRSWRPAAPMIDIQDLLGSVDILQSPGTRIGWPDEPTLVDVSEPRRFCTVLDNALRAFRDLRGGATYLVCAEVNAYHRSVEIRMVQRGPSEDRKGKVEPALERAFGAIRAAAARNGGELHYWGGNNYFQVSLPFRGPVREEFPDVKHLPWNERYHQLLERETWGSLRGRVFRFSKLAESFAARCVEFEMSRILIPSVGLCLDPWLFANRGLTVTATELAGTALAALSEPGLWPRLFSREAYERWDIAQSASYATQGNPEHFAEMPDLQDPVVRQLLRERITFALADWTELPLANASVDAIFATNALPRESSTEQVAVLKEWVRVLRPGGIAFIAQHNFFDFDIEPILRDSGWVKANILRGERPAHSDAVAFQVYLSSG